MAVSFPLFSGAFNRQRSPRVSIETTINLFCERPLPGAPKADSPSYARPGVRLFASATGPIRAGYNHNGRVFVVGGSIFYELNSNGTVTERGGPMVLNASPATISANAVNELFITSGGEGYLFNTSTNVFSNITSPTFPAHSPAGLYLGSYFIALSGADGRFQLSGIEDGSQWLAIDFGLEQNFSDKVIQIARINDTLCLLGQQHSELWYNSGNASFPFQPLQAGLIEHGIAAPYTAVVTDNHLYFMARNTDGAQIVVRLNGVTPERISTPAIETMIASAGDYWQAVAGSFQMQGHLFYVLYVPNLAVPDFGSLALVYDVSTSLWYLWGHWRPATGSFIPFFGTTFWYAWGQNFCGDRQSGAIYAMDMPQNDPAFASDAIVVVA